MPADYVSYWKPETADAMLGDDNHLLGHSASAQYGRVEPGDTVWIVTTWSGGQLILVGSITVDQRVDQATAARILGTDDLWDAPHHILSAPGHEEIARETDITDLAPLLRFESSHDRLDVNDGRVNPQQLQSMRRLTPASAALLRQRRAEDDTLMEAMLDAPAPGSASAAGFGDSVTNREVERAAVAHVTRELEREGWSVQSLEADHVGYDLRCTRGDEERHVEVKGTRGAEIGFVATVNELRRALSDNAFWLYIVTSALGTEPTLHHFDAQETTEGIIFEPIAFRATYVRM